MLEKKDGQTICPFDPESQPPAILIENGRVIDPANDIDETLTVAIKEGKIVSVAQEAPDGFSADTTIDASGLWITPGLVDLHVHLREPGREDKETIETGTQAAAAGGFTAIACMPNTNPVLDEESKIRYVIQRSEKCPCRIYPVGSITKNLEGDVLSPFGEMVKAGAKAVSDDGKSVYKSNMMRNAFNYSKSFNIPVMCHCEDPDLAGGGHMNESNVSTRLGIHGIPSISEEIIVARDTMLAEYTGAHVHICHVSTAGSVQLIRWAKKRGARVTSETCPHYFVFTDEDLETYDTCRKMNPPLRTPGDKEAIIKGIADGTIDIIVSDHAPHCAEEKEVEFDAAAFGVIGLETMLGASITYLINNDILSPSELVNKMSVIPNSIFGLSGGNLSQGSNADITIIDPKATWQVDPSLFFSKSRNSAFTGMELTGFARWTILGGKIVFERKKV
jgi:dihydroorotase